MHDVERGPAPAERSAVPLARDPGQTLRFADHWVPPTPVSGINVQCRLRHFAIVSYAVDPEPLRGLIPPRFRLDTVRIDGRTAGADLSRLRRRGDRAVLPDPPAGRLLSPPARPPSRSLPGLA